MIELTDWREETESRI